MFAATCCCPILQPPSCWRLCILWCNIARGCGVRLLLLRVVRLLLLRVVRLLLLLRVVRLLLLLRVVWLLLWVGDSRSAQRRQWATWACRASCERDERTRWQRALRPHRWTRAGRAWAGAWAGGGRGGGHVHGGGRCRSRSRRRVVVDRGGCWGVAVTGRRGRRGGVVPGTQRSYCCWGCNTRRSHHVGRLLRASRRVVGGRGIMGERQKGKGVVRATWGRGPACVRAQPGGCELACRWVLQRCCTRTSSV